MEKQLSKTQRLIIMREMGCCVKACWRPDVELHHIRTAANSGTGMKPSDDWLVPLCSHHHHQGHRIGWKTFQKRYQLDLVATAKTLAQIKMPMP